MNTLNTPTGPTDEVAAQLRDLERQGGGMARMAHIFAALLLVTFSLGSLISISNAPFLRFLRHPNIPDFISLLVSAFLVISADVALLYAASVLRVLFTSQAPRAEMRLHGAAMLIACVLESSTYLYMVWTFDRPTTWFLWGIGIGRALAAPLCAAYLSMARPLPVGPRDIAYNAALAAGKGVVRDVTELAADRTAPLARKVRIYNAASIMNPADRARFAAIIDAVEEAPAESRSSTPPHPGGGQPLPPLEQDGGNEAGESQRRTVPFRMISGTRGSAQAKRGKRSRNERLRALAFAALDDDPTLPKTHLAKLLHTRQETASALYAQWQNQRERKQVASR